MRLTKTVVVYITALLTIYLLCSTFAWLIIDISFKEVLNSQNQLWGAILLYWWIAIIPAYEYYNE